MARLRTSLFFTLVALVSIGSASISWAQAAPAAPAKEAVPAAKALPARTALDDYIAAPDPAYQWKLARAIPGNGITTYIIDMTSQTWRTPKDVNRTLWQHWLIVVKPDEVKSDIGFLFITGGGNDGEMPEGASLPSIQLARGTNSVIAELRMIPNQPLVFHNDGKPRKEDDLIGYAWIQFMKTGDPTWLPRFPMVKAAVRAMDTLTAFCASPDGGGTKVDRFVVAGGSKRGWTTWLTGVADPRVVAIMPIVIDLLNLRDSMQHHYEAYGFWAEAVGDYVHHKVMDHSNTPEYTELLELVDPYSYRHRLTMPKFIINASGDEFFLPDSSQFYYDDLVGEKHIRYVPNANHSLGGTDVVDSVMAFYQSILSGTPRPEFSWTMADDGSIEVHTVTPPKAVTLWAATNPSARDFRLDTIGKAYKPTPLAEVSPGEYVGRVEKPEQGFTAYFVELTFDSGGKAPFKFSTPVRVVPDVLPFKGKMPTGAAAGGE